MPYPFDVIPALRLPERQTAAGNAAEGIVRDPLTFSVVGIRRVLWHDLVMRYAIVIERAKANYSGYVPDLPGCIATGATASETETMLREAIELHIAGMKEDGIAVPPPSSEARYVDVRVAGE